MYQENGQFGLDDVFRQIGLDWWIFDGLDRLFGWKLLLLFRLTMMMNSYTAWHGDVIHWYIHDTPFPPFSCFQHTSRRPACAGKKGVWRYDMLFDWVLKLCFVDLFYDVFNLFSDIYFLCWLVFSISFLEFPFRMFSFVFYTLTLNWEWDVCNLTFNFQCLSIYQW